MRPKPESAVHALGKRIEAFILNHKSILIIVGLWLYAHFLLLASVRKQIWHDEAFQYLLSLKPVSYIIDGADVHPPLYNIFTHYLTKIFGNDIMQLRWVGAGIFALGFVFVMYYFIKDVFGEKPAFWTSMMLAITPILMYYSMEFRNYSFTLFFVAIQMWMFHKLIAKFIVANTYSSEVIIIPSALYYALSSTVLLYSHYLTALIILTQIIYILALRWRKEITTDCLKVMWFCLTIIGLMCIPLMFYTLKMLSQSGAMWFKGIGLISLISTFCYIITPPLTIPIGIVTLVYGIAIYGLIRWRKELSHQHLLFVLYLIVPILTMWLLTVTKVLVLYHPRYFLWCGIGLFVLAGWVLAKLGEQDAGLDDCLFVLFAILCAFAFLHGGDKAYETDIEDSVLFLANYTGNITCGSDCITIHDSQWSQSPYRMYLPGTRHYLISNLTVRQQFTRGGSVLDWSKVYPNISAVPKVRYMFYVSDVPLPSEEIIYRGEGIYVQKLN
jgi:hypothetical protein